MDIRAECPLKKTILFIVVTFLLMGCATIPKGPPLPSSYTFSYSYGEVWDATIDAITDIGLTAKAIEKESGIISTEPINIVNIVFPDVDPATIGFMGYGKTRALTTIRVKKISNNETSVDINAHVQYFQNIPFSGYQWKYLEPEIHRNRFQNRLILEIISKLPFGSGRIGLAYNLNNQVAVVVETLPDSPAKNAGLQKGDKIISINGKRLTDDEFYNLQILTLKKPGDTMEIVVERNGKELLFTVIAE